MVKRYYAYTVTMQDRPTTRVGHAMDAFVKAADYDALLLIAKRQFQCLRPIRDAGKDCHCQVCEILSDSHTPSEKPQP